MKTRVLVTTVPFGAHDRECLRLLETNNISYVLNPHGQKLNEDQLKKLVPDFDVLIAGTEPITRFVLNEARNLKLISRVGVGLDSVDLLTCAEKNIAVSYTPDAPVNAVAELTIGLIFSLLRSVHISNLGMRQGKWARYFGKRITECSIGLIGYGRIGRAVASRLLPLHPKSILVHDIRKLEDIKGETVIKVNVGLEELLQTCDVISIHVPLTKKSFNMLTKTELELMRSDAYIINTARGGIVNENDLYNALSSKVIAGAAVDVFEKEPYDGPLIYLENCLLTSHMGSMSLDCRAEMERRATQNVVDFILHQRLPGRVPLEEYDLQRVWSRSS